MLGGLLPFIGRRITEATGEAAFTKYLHGTQLHKALFLTPCQELTKQVL